MDYFDEPHERLDCIDKGETDVTCCEKLSAGNGAHLHESIC